MLRTPWRLAAETRRLTAANQQLQLDLAAAERARLDAEVAARRTAERNLRLAEERDTANLRAEMEAEDYALLEANLTGRLQRMIRACISAWAELDALRRQLRDLKAQVAALDSRLVAQQQQNEAAYRAAYDAAGGPQFDIDEPFGQLPATNQPIVADRPSPADLARTATRPSQMPARSTR
ncbi:hypothetical protein GCM10010406_21670 [Streptomyces thermolineatus]|uniref:Uncharacterized protein n=1 Tax=Streptomyces thermolineatus TaxID=44033 RepID=A0ABP5YQB2_9ACTN